MSPIEQHSRTLWQHLAGAWSDFIRATFQGEGQSSDWAMHRLGDEAQRVMEWADVLESAKLRFRATRQPSLRFPRGLEPSVAAVMHYNDWYAPHARQSLPLIRWRRAKFLEAERHYLQHKAVTIEHAVRHLDVPDKRLLPSRLRRFRRDTVGEVANVAQQIELAVPEIGDRFPMSSYHSREDSRVRPTHAAMNGLVAVRAWEGWQWCRPLCGYNCRCGLRHWARFECARNGWMDAKGNPLFEVRWPSPLAKANYLRGVPFHGNPDPKSVPPKIRKSVFPDPGPWMMPKFTAAGGIPETQAAA